MGVQAGASFIAEMNQLDVGIESMSIDLGDSEHPVSENVESLVEEVLGITTETENASQSEKPPEDPGEINDGDIIENPEIEELDENQFSEMDEEIGALREDSVIDKYLHEIQNKIKARAKHNLKPVEYENGTFWIHPKSPSFVLGGDDLDPTSLYHPRVFLWFPHHFMKDMRCPQCNSKLESLGYNHKPRARRITDLSE
jgi:uncharacterized Zn-finger protein